MSFNELPQAAKYTIIFSIILSVTISLLIVRYIYFRRKEKKAWKRLHKDVEFKYDTLGYIASQQAAPTSANSPPSAISMTEMHAKTTNFDPHHDLRHSDIVPQPAPIGQISKPPKPPFVQHRRNESTHTDLSHVPTIFNVKALEQPLLARRQRRYSDSYRDSLGTGVSYPFSSVTKSSAALPASPFAYSPVSDDGIITSPKDDEVYVRAPRLYDPPILAYGQADLPFFHRRNQSKSSVRSARSMSRNRSVSMTNLPKLMRMPTNFSIASNGSRRGRRGHERVGSFDEWIDTLTVIDDSEMYNVKGTPDSSKPTPLFAARGSDRRPNGSVRYGRNRSASATTNVALNDIIAEERESFSSKSSSTRTPVTARQTPGNWNDQYQNQNSQGYQNPGYGRMDPPRLQNQRGALRPVYELPS